MVLQGNITLHVRYALAVATVHIQYISCIAVTSVHQVNYIHCMYMYMHVYNYVPVHEYGTVLVSRMSVWLPSA